MNALIQYHPSLMACRLLMIVVRVRGRDGRS